MRIAILTVACTIKWEARGNNNHDDDDDDVVAVGTRRVRCDLVCIAFVLNNEQFSLQFYS